ncbi:MAG: DUF2786 domain-containing protein [Deltaproteobacteria bacterium]|nr:DUF2786 domain-containing protein [Deltaproteobacteria bacterium]
MFGALSAELERLLVLEVSSHYEWTNRDRFGSRLRPPVIALADSATRLGCWISATRTLELSRSLVVERPWHEVTAVLEHEMAHQFVDEVLGVRGETAHGETFRRVCADRGIDATAAGLPVGATAAANHEIDRTVDRIRKLLALAGSANQHEAEIAMRRAHELMLRHNIEATAARVEQAYELRHLGDPLKRTNRVESEIMHLLSQAFFVKVIRVPVYVPLAGRGGSVYEILGTHANVEMAAHVYEFMIATAERLWAANRGDARVRSGRDRLSYQAGVVRGFREKLGSERTELRGTGLVWLGDQSLEGYYRKRHPRIVTRTSRVRVDDAHAAGREAGRTVVLHKPVTSTGSSGDGPRLLRG